MKLIIHPGGALGNSGINKQIDLHEKKSPLIVACLPAYNEAQGIAGVILQVRKYVDEVIVCDDGSTDYTGDIAEALGAHVLRHEKNQGKGAAMRTAFRYISSLCPDVTVVLDADGQHDPADIPNLIKPIIEDNVDIVVGSRFVDGSKSDPPFYRKIGLKMFNGLSKMGKSADIKDTQSGYRALSQKALDIMYDCESNGFGVESEQLAIAEENGLKVVEVAVNIRYSNIANPSTINPISHGAEIFSTILRCIVEERPLLLLGFPGIISSIIGVLFGLNFLFTFNETRYFSMPMALITMGCMLLGIILIITSLILYSLSRSNRYIEIQVNRAKDLNSIDQ